MYLDNIFTEIKHRVFADKIINEIKIGDNGYGFVIENGIVTAHPDDNFINKEVKGETWYENVNSGSGFKWIIVDNKRYYAGYKNFDNYTFVGLVTRADYYQELNRVLIESIRLMIFSIVVMIIVTFFVIRKLLMPIKHLVKGLGIIADDLDARIEGSYNDEFDEIKDAVNSMADDIKKHMNIISGIEYASRIQKNLLPPDSSFVEFFEDYSCIWKPKDIVGGDIYRVKSFNEGAVLCACDCTGHGTPGALLTMLVVSAFEAVVTPLNYKDTAQIIWELEKRLVSELNVNNKNTQKGLIINDGCDLAVLFIAREGSVSISAGNTNIFICDGKKVTRIKGQKLRVGDSTLKRKEDVEVTDIQANPNNKFYIATDGLYEQIGRLKEDEQLLPFGFKRFEKLILENHAKRQSVIADNIWKAFEEYRGGNARRDDFQLITFKPKIINGGNL
jgi:serine phosphatase RsbU (regulator of sigma subunit)